MLWYGMAGQHVNNTACDYMSPKIYMSMDFYLTEGVVTHFMNTCDLFL